MSYNKGLARRTWSSVIRLEPTTEAVSRSRFVLRHGFHARRARSNPITLVSLIRVNVSPAPTKAASPIRAKLAKARRADPMAISIPAAIRTRHPKGRVFGPRTPALFGIDDVQKALRLADQWTVAS